MLTPTHLSHAAPLIIRCLRILERDQSSQTDSLPICNPCKLLRHLLSKQLLLRQKGGVDVTKTTRNTALSREELLEKLAAVTKEKRMLAKKINRNAKKTKVYIYTSSISSPSANHYFYRWLKMEFHNNLYFVTCSIT